jgi:ribosome-binding factor A
MSNRIEKINSLLRDEISKIIFKNFDFPEGTIVTLTRVETTANLIEAKVFISVFPEEKSKKVIEILGREIFDIQQEINKKLNMRPIPKIIFVQDKNPSQAGRIEEILEALKKDEK